jgi:hypothetical protein
MGRMTSADHCYCGARGTREGATSAHSSDGPSNISGPLLLPPTMVMGRLTSVVVATVGTWPSDISSLSPLATTVATNGHSLLLFVQ